MICSLAAKAKIRKKISDEFEPYFQAMIETMLDNYQEKGDSWKELSWCYLMDRAAVQFEDMINRDDEDFYANMGNYAAMLWINTKEGRIKDQEKDRIK